MLGAYDLRTGIGLDPAGLAVDHHAVSLQDLDPVALQQSADAAGEAADNAVLPLDGAREVDGRPLDPQPEGRRLGLRGRVRVGVGRMDDCLRRNAADIEAGAAEPAIQAALLHQHDIEAELAGAYGRDIAAGAAAQDQNLGNDLGHLTPL